MYKLLNLNSPYFLSSHLFLGLPVFLILHLEKVCIINFSETSFYNLCSLGRAIAQAVSRRHPTAAAWVPAQVRSRGICGGVALGQVFS
jgi:hypothetical protein